MATLKEVYDLLKQKQQDGEDKPKKRGYCNPILDFRLDKRPALY